MMPISRSLVFFAALAVFFLGTGPCQGEVVPGKVAPVFTLKDKAGVGFNLSDLKTRSMTILYFFDVDSGSSREGLKAIDQLVKDREKYEIVAWAITLSPKEKVVQFANRTNPSFPILLDDAGVSETYQARLILPTVCILGPGLKILDYFQGGGKTSEVMLIRVAEKELQRRKTAAAKALSEKILEKDPQNPKAKTIRGHAELKEGNLIAAEQTFLDISQQKGEGEVLGKEGLAAVYARKGEREKALSAIQAVEKSAPDRPYVHVIKGDMLYEQNRKSEAGAEYLKATQKKSAEPYQKAVAYNKLGRLQAGLGNYKKSRELYELAESMDPYYIEATSNKGITYEKEGRYDKALETYERVLTIDSKDTFASVLAKKAQEMLDIQKDTERKKRMDSLVQSLAERYRNERSQTSLFKTEDTWTSRPMVLSFIDFQEKGGLSERDGLSMVLTTQLADQLNASGRVQVVERVLVERVLEELNLGSSALADPETALKLGKILAAKLIGTGALYYMPDRALLNLRLIDTETGRIPMVVNEELASSDLLEKEIRRLNRGILKNVIQKYPLRGYLVQVEGEKVVINLGSRQGVVTGTRFQILEDQEPVKYKGKMLRGLTKTIGEVEITDVGSDLSYARTVSQQRTLKGDDKVEELVTDSATGVANADR